MAVGSIDELGAWNNEKGLSLIWNEGNIWRNQFNFSEYFEYKFVLIEGDKIKRWETGDNRVFNFSDYRAIIETNKEGNLKIKQNDSSTIVHEYNPNNNGIKIIAKWR